jgi:hypothetical protein
MQKIKLDLEVLVVESFEAAALPAERGTVQANEAPTLPVQDCFFSVFPTCGIYC